MDNQCQNAILLARMCNYYNTSPADELGILELPHRLYVNIGTYIAYCLDENEKMKTAEDKATDEAKGRNKEVEKERRRLRSNHKPTVK